MYKKDVETAISNIKYGLNYEVCGNMVMVTKFSASKGVEALEKQNPMKIKEVHVDEYFCPACGSENNCSDGVVGDNYCPNCGQRLER